MVVTGEHIKRFKNALALKSDSTYETYFIFVNLFLEFSGPYIDRNKVIEFLSTLSKNSILTAYYAIRFFHKAAGIPFDVSRGDIAPKGIKRIQEVLSQEEIVNLINGSRKHFGVMDVGYVVLSTIYGTRRVEMYNMEAEDIDVDNRVLIIRPKKVGEVLEERKHLIPEEIAPYMFDMKEALEKIKSKPSIQTLNFLFDAMCEKSGVELRPRLGWHSVRRAVDSGLLTSGIEYVLVKHFIRWKARAPEMPIHYLKDWKQFDGYIFQKHPFLKLWSTEEEQEVEHVPTKIPLEKEVQNFLEKKDIIKGY